MIKFDKYQMPICEEELTFGMVEKLAYIEGGNNLAVISALSGAPVEWLAKVAAKQIIELIQTLHWLTSERIAVIMQSFEEQPKGVLDLEAERYLAFTQLSTDSNTIFETRAIAVACFFGEFQKERLPERIKEIREMRAQKVFGLSNFFLSSLKR